MDHTFSSHPSEADSTITSRLSHPPLLPQPNLGTQPVPTTFFANSQPPFAMFASSFPAAVLPSSVPSTLVVNPGHPHGPATTTPAATAATAAAAAAGHANPPSHTTQMMTVVVAVSGALLVGFAVAFALCIRRIRGRSTAIFAPPAFFSGVAVDTTTAHGIALRTFGSDAHAAAAEAYAREQARRHNEGLNELGEAPPAYKPLEAGTGGADANTTNAEPPAYTPSAAAPAPPAPVALPPARDRHGTSACPPPRYPSPIPLADLRPHPGASSNPPA